MKNATLNKAIMAVASTSAQFQRQIRATPVIAKGSPRNQKAVGMVWLKKTAGLLIEQHASPDGLEVRSRILLISDVA